MNFSALIPSLVSGTQDMIICGINITEERKLSVDFSDPYYYCNAVMVIRKENSSGYVSGSDSPQKGSFIESVKTGFKRNILEEKRYMLILDGLKLTVIISLLSCLLGTLLGAFVCWMRMSRRKFLNWIANIYIALMRGMPVLVLLMIMFYVIFAGTSVNPVTVAVITFGMNFAAYVSEMFRSAIESVDKGQTEAGVALGFTPFKTFIYIVLPQAFKQVLPVFKGETISLVKTTSIVGFIAVQDLTKVGDIIRSRTFDAFFPLIMVAVLYFLISWLFAAILDFIGKKAS
jgi:polar amino acid transport system substrate-binding protein